MPCMARMDALTCAADLIDQLVGMRWSSLPSPTTATPIDTAMKAMSIVKIAISLVLIDRCMVASRRVNFWRQWRFGGCEDAADVEDHHKLVVQSPDAPNEFRAPAGAELRHLIGDDGIEVGDRVDLVC